MSAVLKSEIVLPTVMRVMPENVTPLWPQLEQLFVPALATVSTHKIEDVRRSLMAMRSQLWAQMDGDLVEAAATTEFADYPAGMYVRVWTCGARRDRRMNDDAFFDILNDWRRMHKCVGFEAIGRHGWLRRCAGARVEGLIMRVGGDDGW
jgi:hypothetical protein